MSEAQQQATLLQMVLAYRLSQAISVGARLGIADLLRDGPVATDALAAQTGTQAPMLYRLLRALAAAGLMLEGPASSFALTPLGSLLRSDVPGSVRAAAAFVSTGHWSLWGHLLDRLRSGITPAGSHFADRWDERPDEAAVFDQYMTELAAHRASAVLRGYDFTGITTLVDVGGGRGRLLARILKAYPDMRGILFDLPKVLDGGARALLEAEGVAARCRVVAGDFFDAVPQGGDAYMFSVVIHDWEDERARVILRNCRRAIAAAGRLLLIERVIPAEGSGGLDILLSDLNMLVGPGGRERTGEEYARLLEAAGFRLARVAPLDPPYSVVEGRPA